MFVNENKIIPFPSKTILEDILSRYGDPDEYSYTPWTGCKEIFDRNFSSEDNVNIGDILSNNKDYTISKSRPNDDGINREYGAYEVNNYYSRLEDISDEFPHKYAEQCIVGFKVRAGGFKQKRSKEKVMSYYYDEEDGEFVDPTDVEEEERDFSTDEIIDAREKLPYLLKQLHSGSIKYRGSLLSVIIATEKCNRRKGSGYIKPGDLAEYGVYKVDAKGDIIGKFSKKDNTGKIYPALCSWAFGDYPNDIYYKAYRELLACLVILDIDITDEDATQYTSDVIHKMVCTYLASNEEYLETYGYCDKKILEVLTPEKLFKAARSITGDNSSDVKVTVDMLCERIAVNAEKLRFKYEDMSRERPKVVMEFIAEYSRRHNVNISKSVLDVFKDIFKFRDGSFFLLDISEFKDDTNVRVGLLTATGYVVKVKPFEFELDVVDIRDVLAFYKGGPKCEWKTVSV